MQLHELLQHIQKLELHCKRISGQKLSGIFRSKVKGSGMMLDSIRKYDQGDDVRNINWNVTARFQETHVNTYIEDKEQSIWVLIDTSKSTLFGTSSYHKFDTSILIAATIIYSALESKNSAGIIFFNNGVTSIIQPGKGQKHFWNIARALIKHQVNGQQTDLTKTLAYLSKTLKKSSVIFIISDFIAEGYSSICNTLSQQHELNAIRVFDLAEVSLPDFGWIKMKDSEKGSIKWVNSATPTFKNSYETSHQHYVNEFTSTFSLKGIKSLSITTGQDYSDQLIQFLKA